MKCLLTKKTAAMFTVAIAFGFGAVCQAQTFFEDFEGGTTMPSTMFFTHDGVSTATQADTLAAEGLPNLGSFAGAVGGSPGSAAAALGLSANGGVGGSQGVVLTLSNDNTTDFAFAGIVQSLGFALDAPTSFTASADVLAPVGYPLSLRIESPFGPTNNGFELNFVGTGAYQTISGVIGTDLTPIAGGTFDTNAIANILVASTFDSIPFGANQEVFIDNFSVAPTSAAIPEPGSVAVLITMGSIFAVRRRRS